MPMTRDERKSRIAELERWLEDQHAEFEDDEFPDDLRAQWQERKGELTEHKRILKELEDRDAIVAHLAEGQSHSNNREDGYDDQPVRRQPGEGKSSPSVIMRMSEFDVYDLNTVGSRSPFASDSRGVRELRDRALRAVELANYGDGTADRARCQTFVQNLLDHKDTPDRQIAQRILLTGSPAYRQAFTKTLTTQLKGSIPALSVEEQRAMEMVSRAMSLTGAGGASGGFAVPYMLDPTVIPTSNLSVNPFRAICRVDTIPGNEWRGVTSAGVSAFYGTEASESTDNSPTLAQPSMLMQRANAFIPVSIELEQDWSGLQGELAQMIQDAKDDLEATKFTVGTGTNEPSGIITGATTVVSTAVSAAFSIGDLYSLEQAVAPRFRPRAQMIANRFIWNKVRQFDTAGGAGLWVYLPAGLDNMVPRGGNIGVQVLGYPANEDSAMAADTNTASKVMVMGDPRYYLIVDRIGLDIEVIPHLFGSASRFPTGQRGFFAYWRNNAKVLDANAFRTLIVK